MVIYILLVPDFHSLSHIFLFLPEADIANAWLSLSGQNLCFEDESTSNTIFYHQITLYNKFDGKAILQKFSKSAQKRKKLLKIRL